MRGAQAMAVRGHVAVAAAFKAGTTELELHQAYLAASGQRETELPYGNIIGLNEHAATLHYQHMRAEAPAVTRSLLIDAGAEFKGYAADITRTYSASATDDFAALIASMDALQQRICEEVKPGVDFVVLHAFTHRQLANVLREHKLVACSADEAVATGITRAFLPHGLGHLLGLQVHDAGGRLADTTGKKREPPRAGSVSAPDAHATARRRRHDRARALFHPVAAAARCSRSTSRGSTAPRSSGSCRSAAFASRIMSR